MIIKEEKFNTIEFSILTANQWINSHAFTLLQMALSAEYLVSFLC